MKKLSWLITISTSVVLIACGDSQPSPAKYFNSKVTVSRYASDQELADCQDARHLIPVPGSYLKWQVIKTKDGEDSKLIGTNAVDGVWRVRGKDMATSDAEFVFDAGSTATEDDLRDDRVKNVIFGLAQHAPLYFRLNALEAIEDGDTTMPDGAARELMAKGSLEVYGKKANISFPMIVKEQGGIYTITPKDLVKLNVRAAAGTENGINLAEHVTQVLSFVSGVTMKDEVTIDFSLAMKNACNAPR